jgi:hypothetical protein
MDKVLPISFCPNCKHQLDRATSTTQKGAFPVPGDFTVCIDCASVLVFTQDLYLRKPTEADWGSVTPELSTHLLKLQLAIMDRQVQRGRNAGTASSNDPGKSNCA